MRKYAMPVLIAGSLTLTACGPGVPIELPEDATKAAQTCFAAKGLVLREGKSAGDKVTYEEFTGAMKYPMIAASEAEPFDMTAIVTILEGADAIAEEVATKDYAGAIAGCDARFKPTALAIPEADQDAIVSCTAMTGFVVGATQDASADFGGDAEALNALLVRLEKATEENPELLVMLIEGKAEELMNGALKDGFAQGDIDGYLSACLKRFPAEE